MGPRMREDNGGEGEARRDGGERAVREPTLPDGCQREWGMGPRIREDKGERRVTVI